MKKVSLLILVIFLTVGIFSGCSSRKKDETANVDVKEALEAVEVMTPSKRDIAISHTLSGKLSGAEDVMIMSELQMPAKVTSVKVKLGDKVYKGQVLFTLDNDNVRKQVEQAQAAYNLAAKNLESQKEQIENAKTNFQRIEQLYKEGAVSKQQYEQSKLGASDTLIETLEAQVNQARVSLSQVTSELEKTVIKSPIAGYAAAINVKENEFNTSSQPAMRIVNTDKLTVNLGIAEQIVNKIYKEQNVKVKVNVATDETLTGVVKAVSPVPDDRTQIYPVEIEIDNKNGLIKPGMFAEIIFDIEKVKNVLSVPRETVRNINGKNYVFVVKEDTAKSVEVEIGLENGNFTEIVNGLTESDNVIVKGQDYVEDGNKVRIIRGEK